MQQGIAAGLPLSTIIANGGGPFQYNFNAGNPLISGKQFDAGPFVQDDWRVKPNITLSLGLRYEVQQNTSDYGDIAPRIGLAWGVGPTNNRARTPKTVVRAGFGIFYTRFPLGDTTAAERFNGTTQVSYTITNPTFFPQAGVPIPSLANLEVPANLVASSTDHVDSNLRAGAQYQSAIGFDRQLPRNTTLSVNYINSKGVHILRTVDINTPLPGTFNPLVAGSGVYPLGAAAGLFQLFESSGNYEQNQLITNMNARINSKISLFGFYAFGHVSTDVLGSPSNHYNFRQDYGPEPYDRRHQVNINGSILLPYGVRMSPNITFNSAPPFNITQGFDLFGDTLTNTRPAIAPAGFVAPTCTQQLAKALTPCLVSNATYGNFLINAPAGIPTIGADSFRGFAQFQFNVRISRTWGFGESTTPPDRQNRQGGAGGRGPGFGQAAGGGGPRGGGGGGGPRGGGGPGGGGGGESSGKKYTLNAGLFVHNVFNNVNNGSPSSDLLSDRFGQVTNLANIGGPGSTAFNRRIDLTLAFSF